MPSFQSIFSVAALAAVAQAITITSPSTSTLWDSSESNTITWTSVSTDPDTVDIYLSHLASQPSLNDVLFQNVATSKGSVDVSGLQLPTGTAYQINFVKPDSPEQIYAQSAQFNVTGSASSATSTLAGYTGPTFTPSASSTSSAASTEAASSSSSASGTDSLTSSASSATASSSTLLTTSTGVSTTSTGTVTSTSSGTSSSETGSSSGTSTATSSSASSTSSSAAVNMAASAPLAAMVFGLIAMFA